MNERIKELADQAGFSLWTDEAWKPEGAEVDWSCNYDLELEKFAELIVRECMKACSRANEITYLVPPSKGQVVVSCMREIEQHFGVEE